MVTFIYKIISELSETNITLSTEEDKRQIYQSLIEARILNNYSQEFILNTVEKLIEYQEKNGNDAIIDTLFCKYLNNSNTNDVFAQAVQALADKGEFTSQYQFAIALLCSANEFNYLRNKLFNQSWKLCTNDIVTIDEVEISKIILFYILKKFDKYFNKDMIIKDINPIAPNENKKIYIEKYDELNAKFAEIIKNIGDIQTSAFWNSYISGQVNKEFTINVEDDPYLFNAAALMCYKHSLIKVNFDISKFKFPEYITIDMMYLIRYQLEANHLINFNSSSIEIKNLCTLVYFLIINQTPFKEIEKFKDVMSSKSFAILILVYMNYTKENVPQRIFDFIMTKLDVHDSRNFLLVRILSIVYKKFGFAFTNDENDDFLYLATTKISINSQKITTARYALLKKMIANCTFIKKDNDEIIMKNKDDFCQFLEKLINTCKGERKLFTIKIYQMYANNYKIKLEMIMYLIDEDKYTDAANLLINLKPNNEQINILKDEKHIKNIKLLLKKIPLNMACDIYEMYNLEDKFDLIEKYDIFLKFSLNSKRFDINRNTLLQDSVKLLMKKDMKNTLIRINYVSEKGQDEGGLAKDWFTNVSDEIIKTNAFITVPNGTSLTFNPNCDDQNIFIFAGKFIALAITNKKTIGLKLTSFIWKKIVNEEITLEDMKDYDSELYQSLKWISENDVSDLMMNFVDSNDEELCENGSNIELTEENKSQFIKLIIEKKLIKSNNDAINNIVNGFKSIIDLNITKNFKSDEIKELVNGKEIIDIKDWKMNTKHNNEGKFNEFFEIISNWSQENLKKLLKFVTGSAIVPFGGFSYWDKYERPFKLEFTRKSTQSLPISHTCFNRIDIPIYTTKELFEQKLLYAIECDDFGFA